MLDDPDPDGSPPPPRASVVPATPPKGASVIGADGRRLGMVSALEPNEESPTHLLVFVAERLQLIPREYPLPVSAIVRIDDAGTVHVGVTRDGLFAVEESRRGDEARNRGVEKKP